MVVTSVPVLEPSKIEGQPGPGHVRGWRRLAAVVIVVGLASIAMVAWRLPSVRSWVRGETNWQGDRRYRPRHPAAAEQVDLARVHATLLPRWIIARSRRTRGVSGADVAEAEAFGALLEALSPDANLADIATQWRALSVPHRLAQDPRRALYLGWAWNRYLADNEAPFMVQASVRSTSFGPAFSAAAYHVDADAMVAVGVGAYRVRLVSRLDTINLREAYLGAAGREDAVVVVDRIREFALAEVWALLDPWTEFDSRARTNFAPAIRRAARAQLRPDDLERLRVSAGARWAITRTLEAIADRRVSCRSGLRINDVPWYGFPAARLARLDAIARRHATRRCPGITAAEVRTLRRASLSLSPDPALESAVEALVAWTAQHVAVHEARHLADDALVDGFEHPLSCASCSDRLGIAARAELSGYLASLAWSPSPTLALYQACRSLAGEYRRPLGAGQPHRQALELLQRRMGPVCLQGPPSQLHQLGRLLEAEMLGRSEPMALPAHFVRRLPAR